MMVHFPSPFFPAPFPRKEKKDHLVQPLSFFFLVMCCGGKRKEKEEERMNRPFPLFFGF